MISRTTRLVLGVSVLVLFWPGAMRSVANGQRSKISVEKGNSSDTAAFVPLKLEERAGAYKKFVEERNHMVYGLLLVMKELRDSPKETIQSSRLHYAVRMLGDLRAAEATQLLMNVIDLRFPGPVSTRAPEDSEVIQALVQIGKTASTGAVEHLANDKSSKRAPMYVRVIAQVEGIELGKVMVRLAADKEKDPEKKARLEAAIALFDKASEPMP